MSSEDAPSKRSSSCVLPVKRANGEKAVEHLTSHEVDAVDETLHLTELRHGEEEQHDHHAHEGENGRDDVHSRPECHPYDLDDGHDARDGGEQ